MSFKVARPNSYVFLFVLVLIVFAPLLGSHISIAQVQDLQSGEEQPFNLVYTIEFDDLGNPHHSSVTTIPPENFHFDASAEEPSVEVTRVEVPQKIHPLLQQWIDREAPDHVVEVVITLIEDQQIPRFPRLVPGQPRTSSANRAILRERESLIEQLRQQRQASQTGLIRTLQPYGLVVLEQYWLINGFLARLPLGSVETVAAESEALYIRPRFGGEPPPNHDGNPNNDVVDARAQIQSDSYFNSAFPFSSIAVLDTGVKYTHVLFRNPRHLGVLRDCVNGDSSCKNTGSTAYNPNDLCNHGTSTIAIIAGNARLGNDFRGVTDDIVDSFKVYTGSGSKCGLDSNAAVRGFQAALARGNDIIVAEMQAVEPETGMIAIKAENAYNMGAIVIAANGNSGPNPGTVRSPALAHKVIGVGAYDIMPPGATDSSQSRGPAPDGRIKPDLQAPTNTETASNVSNTSLQVFRRTSGATPYVGAAAALVKDWLLTAFGSFFDPGQIYAWLIASGQSPFPLFNNTTGAGKLKLPLGGTARIGKLAVSNGQTIDITISTVSGDRRIDAAIWWPESATQTHNNIDIQIFDPSNTVRTSSTSVPSVFERARVDGSPLAVGTWKLRIRGVAVPVAPQTTYFYITRTPFIP